MAFLFANSQHNTSQYNKAFLGWQVSEVTPGVIPGVVL